jgi:hypothetical protein
MCFTMWVSSSKVMGLHALIMIFVFLSFLTLMYLDLMNLKFTNYMATTLMTLEWVVINHLLHFPLVIHS